MSHGTALTFAKTEVFRTLAVPEATATPTYMFVAMVTVLEFTKVQVLPSLDL